MKSVQESVHLFEEIHGKKKSYHAVCLYLVKLGAKPFHQVYFATHFHVIVLDGTSLAIRNAMTIVLYPTILLTIMIGIFIDLK